MQRKRFNLPLNKDFGNECDMAKLSALVVIMFRRFNVPSHGQNIPPPSRDMIAMRPLNDILAPGIPLYCHFSLQNCYQGIPALTATLRIRQPRRVGARKASSGNHVPFLLFESKRIQISSNPMKHSGIDFGIHLPTTDRASSKRGLYEYSITYKV